MNQRVVIIIIIIMNFIMIPPTIMPQCNLSLEDVTRTDPDLWQCTLSPRQPAHLAFRTLDRKKYRLGKFWLAIRTTSYGIIVIGILRVHRHQRPTPTRIEGNPWTMEVDPEISSAEWPCLLQCRGSSGIARGE